jgi:hypothetical protein
MATHEQTLPKAVQLPQITVSKPARVGRTVMAAPFAALGRVLVGPARGPRQYRREGFPESELYRIIYGRQDRFQGL